MFVATYAITRAIEWAAGWRYNPFTDGMDVGRLTIDLGLWLAVFWVVLWGLRRRTAHTAR